MFSNPDSRSAILRRAGRLAAKATSSALLVLAGAVVAPRIAGATISSGERDAFVPLTPARIFDTRDGTGLAGGVPAKIGAGQTVEFQVRGQGGVSATATAVTLNVTGLNATATTHLTLFPAGTVAPNASSLNVTVGQIVPNAVTVKIGTTGKVAVRNNSGTINVFVDVNGFYDDHNHDDRYYTKAAVDAIIAGSNYVGSNQIIDASVTQADRAYRDYPQSGNLGAFTWGPRECKIFSMGAQANLYPVGRLAIPNGDLPSGFHFLPGLTEPGSSLSFNAVTWQVCNSSPNTVTPSGGPWPYVVRVEI